MSFITSTKELIHLYIIIAFYCFYSKQTPPKSINSNPTQIHIVIFQFIISPLNPVVVDTHHDPWWLFNVFQKTIKPALVKRLLDATTSVYFMCITL